MPDKYTEEKPGVGNDSGQIVNEIPEHGIRLRFKCSGKTPDTGVPTSADPHC